jgi:hypothetical protein
VGDLTFESVGSIDFLMGKNCNKILLKTGDVDISNAHLQKNCMVLRRTS